MQEAICVRGLGKQFRRYTADRPSTLKEALLRGLSWTQAPDRFWALRGVSFSVPGGRTVGIIGPNGAGKSTLLRLVGGVGVADEGSIAVSGRVGTLLDLGEGFHPDLTGRENVFVNGVISGLRRGEVARRLDSIVDFAELEEFIDYPLRAYSNGMRLRLGFAIAVHTDPEVLLIDEILAVGDILFREKCLRRIAEFKERGCSILLVSHDLGMITRFCDEALWLRGGQLVAHGPADVVTSQYEAEMSTETRKRTPAGRAVVRTQAGQELRLNENRFGSLEMELTSVRLVGRTGGRTESIDSGDPLRVEMEFVAQAPISDPIFGVTISREDGTVCCDTSTRAKGIAVPSVVGRGRISFQVERMDLVGGQYYVDVGVYEREWAYAYDYHWHVYPLVVHSAGSDKGILCPPHTWKIDLGAHSPEW
jgi:lipopolysaccharide transport system ATP-binding protein